MTTVTESRKMGRGKGTGGSSTRETGSDASATSAARGDGGQEREHAANGARANGVHPHGSHGTHSNGARRNGTAPAEQLTLVPSSPWWGEHRSRYHLAASWVRGATVLDIACGTGFGSEILADAGARLVAGADLELDPVTRGIRRDDVAFLNADGAALPFATGSLDVVTSFETIEHARDDAAFVGELRRVLKPSGRLLLSTPNALRSRRAADGRPAKPFDVREYEPQELHALLRQHFREVTLLGQVTKSYYPVSPFWEDPAIASRDPLRRLQTLVWKVENRLPFAIKDGMSRFLHNRAFFPGEFDFDFVPEQVERGHVTVAVCRP